MQLIGFIVTCVLSVSYGRYLLHALVRNILNSRFGLSGEHKVLKEMNVHRFMKNIGVPMGIGAGIVVYINGLDWSAVVIFSMFVCLVPGVLFGILRVLRHAAISLDKRIDAYFSGGK
jgi:hypothetical protein